MPRFLRIAWFIVLVLLVASFSISHTSLFKSSTNYDETEVQWVKTEILQGINGNKSNRIIEMVLDSLKKISLERKYPLALETIHLLETSYKDDFSTGLKKLIAMEENLDIDHPIITPALFYYYSAQFFYKHKLVKESLEKLEISKEYAIENCEIDIWLSSETELLKRNKNLVLNQLMGRFDQNYKLAKIYDEKGKAISILTNLIYFNYLSQDTIASNQYLSELDSLLVGYDDLDTLFRPLYYLRQEYYALQNNYEGSDSIIDLGMQVEYFHQNPVYKILLLLEKSSNCLDRIRNQTDIEPHDSRTQKLGERGLEILSNALCLVEENRPKITDDNYYYIKTFIPFLRGNLYKSMGDLDKSAFYFNRILSLFAKSREYTVLSKDLFEKEAIDNLKDIVDKRNEYSKFGQYYLSYLASKKTSRDLYEKNVYEYFNIIQTSALENKLSKSKNLIILQSILVLILFLSIFFIVIMLNKNRKDINEMHSKNEQLLVLNDELLLANRYMKKNMKHIKNAKESTDLFMRMSAHDLITPVRNIVMMLELVKRKINISTRKLRFDYIFDEAQSLYQLLTDFNAYLEQTSQYKSIKITSCDVREVIDILLEEMIISNDISVELINLGIYPFDKNAFKKVMYNLIHNSIKFRSAKRPLKITIRQYDEDDNDVLEITDNGRGIEDKYHRTIFELFDKKPDENQKGSRIGLSVCREIIENQGGSIDLRSRYGYGTSFFIRTNRVEKMVLEEMTT